MFEALSALKKARDDVKATIGDLDELKSKNSEDKETLEPLI